MSEKSKNILICVLIIGIVCMLIAYIALTISIRKEEYENKIETNDTKEEYEYKIETNETKEETTEEVTYIYDTPAGRTNDEPQSGFYLKINTSTYKAEEVCGVFDKGTVCLKYNSKKYYDNFNKDCTETEDKCTVTGYIAEKKSEMEEKGTTCSFDQDRLICKNQKIYCSIDAGSDIECSTLGESNNHFCQITTDGGFECY